jgi:hypothetical protein
VAAEFVAEGGGLGGELGERRVLAGAGRNDARTALRAIRSIPSAP